MGEDYTITETFEDGAEHVPPRRKEGAAGSAAGTLEISPEAMLHPEQYFPRIHLKGKPPVSSRDPELVDSPFGSIRRGEL